LQSGNLHQLFQCGLINMAIYPIVHKETGEKRVVEMSIHDIQQWYKDNPEWQRDWSEGCASAAEVGDWKDTKVPGGFKDVLGRIKKNHPRSTFEV
jgi:hypothetical protein